jgi:hypothetical protein
MGGDDELGDDGTPLAHAATTLTIPATRARRTIPGG